MSEIVDLGSAGLRPLVLRGINKIWPGKLRLNADNLIATAIKQIKSDDFGDDWSAEPLRKLVEACNSEGRLSPVGAFIMRERLKGALTTRLRAVKLLNEHPEILETEVAPIWVITGLQRTGTTYLQRLMAGDPSNRSILSWETLDPVPNGDRYETSRRVKKARFSEKALKWISPGFFAIHPVDHTGPEEDVLLLDPTFLSTAPEAMAEVPSFGHWLEGQDHTKAYAWERKMLKLLQWQRPAQRWILKSPHHLEHLDAFLTVFPKANVIWTHRDPAESLPSFLSMVYHGRAMFSDDVSAAEVRDHWLRKSQIMIEKGMEFRNRHPDRVADLSFSMLVNDPVEAVRGVYAKFGEELTSEAEAGMRKVMSSHQRHRFGIHKYDANAFDLKQEVISSSFEEYYQLLKAEHVG